ncbi:hypothetical protein SAMN02745216_05311 [Desulfatibacillum alkenivorans DSM 16219]|jgi:hypothetical protein|uniref:Uncharacterized protein n=1 Tax=Desulfatibacillum alkenivorans DSM 16219 TaxID=1121393 RepID=A0A1M7BGC0_9BACT|nr:hypothetical protein [Desulfatibacillum alkenivorans]SHL54078.1 hypothetical protein SAMN02745216_05311 [Desulfatibacillum alkenivorans DSM 16219]
MNVLRKNVVVYILFLLPVIVFTLIFMKSNICENKLTCYSFTKKDGKGFLIDLLQRNNIIKKIPDAHDKILTGEIQCFSAFSPPDKHILSVYLEYPVSTVGDRGYSFVFNEEAECLLWSQDSLISFNGNLLDFTGDGKPEKIFRYKEKGSEPHPHDIWDRIIVYSLSSAGESKILLDVKYYYYTKDGFAGHVSISAGVNETDEMAFLSFQSFEDSNVFANFKWSRKKEKFELYGSLFGGMEILYPETLGDVRYKVTNCRSGIE